MYGDVIQHDADLSCTHTRHIPLTMSVLDASPAPTMAYSNESLRSRGGAPITSYPPQQFISPPHSTSTSPTHTLQTPYTAPSITPTMPSYHQNHVTLSPYHGDVGINLEGGEGGYVCIGCICTIAARHDRHRIALHGLKVHLASYQDVSMSDARSCVPPC